MNEYRIKFIHNDMPGGYVSKSIKWAHDEKEAVRLLLKKNPEKDGRCTFKRGGSGKILSVEPTTN